MRDAGYRGADGSCICWGADPHNGVPYSNTFFGPTCARVCRSYCFSRGMCSSTQVAANGNPVCECDDPERYYGQRCQLAVNPGDDTLPPHFATGFPRLKASATRDRRVVVQLQLDEPAEGFVLAVRAADVVEGHTPTAADIIQGVYSANAAAATVAASVVMPFLGQTFEVTVRGLRPDSDYLLYSTAKDASGNANSAVSGRVVAFRTAVDTSAPITTTGLPHVDVTSHTRMELTVGFNEPSDVAFVVVRREAVAPTVAEVLAGVAAGGVAAVAAGTTTIEVANTESTVQVTGLRASRLYSVYVAAQDRAFPTQHRLTAPIRVDFATPADAMPPVNVGGYPRVDVVSDTFVRVEVAVDEVSFIYAALFPAGSPAPTADDVRDGTGPLALQRVGPISASGGVAGGSSLSFADLPPESAFDIYVVAADASPAGNQQAAPTLLQITTLEDQTPPEFGASYPVVSTVVDVEAELAVSLSEPGVAYIAVVAALDLPPATALTSDQVISGTAGNGINVVFSGSVNVGTGGVEETLTIPDLEADTDYVAFIVAADQHTVPNVQPQPSVVFFSTTPPIYTVAPMFEEGYPTVVADLPYAATVQVVLNRAGSYAFVVTPEGSPAPTAGQVRTATSASGYVAFGWSVVSPIAAQNGAVIDFRISSGLVGNTNYEAYFVTWDSEGHQSVEPVVATFTTPRELVPPQFLQGSPTAAATRTDRMLATASVSEPATVYLIVAPATNPAVSVADVLAGSVTESQWAASFEVTVPGVATTAVVSGLAPSTAYVAYFVVVDTSGNVQPVMQTRSFVTPEPRCNDGYQNGEETGVDCGGSTCVGCPVGAACTKGGDCASFVCDESNGVCLAPTCDDGVKNAAEGGIDCGQGCGTRCELNSECRIDEDCFSCNCSGDETAAGTCEATQSTCGRPISSCLFLGMTKGSCGASPAECDELVPHINTALAEWDLTCPERLAAFISLTRVASDGFTSLLTPDAAGALHLTADQVRSACSAIPSLKAAFASEFPVCAAAAVGAPPEEPGTCACGTDAGVLAIAARHRFAFRTAAWWFAEGAAEADAALCSDLLSEADLGLGFPADDVAPGSAFFRAAACLADFDRDTDLQAGQLQAYIDAWRVFEAGFDTCGAVCALSEYELQPCDPDEGLVRTCATCTVCGADEFAVVPCAPEHDRECAPVRPPCLEVGWFEAQAPTATSDRVCSPCSPQCAPGFFEANDCEPTRDRTCLPCSSECDVPGTFKSGECTATADIVCSVCSACGPGERVGVPCITADTVCVPATCADGTKSGWESDVDCGGAPNSNCAGCADGRVCSTATDCLSLSCADRTCVPATCSDGIANGGESDVDCGGLGACGPCGAGRECSNWYDCESHVCGEDGLCQEPTCDDGALNGDETGVDCGGPLCGACAPGRPCDSSEDCTTFICDPDVGICLDYCGIDTYPCADGEACQGARDCESGACVEGECVPCENGSVVNGVCECWGSDDPGPLSQIYYGEACQHRCRTDLCNGRGMCSPTEPGVCECFEPLRFEGDFCNVSTCGVGYAIYETPDSVTCVCPDGHTGERCETVVECINGEEEGGNCQCEPGWYGDDCSLPLFYQPPCLNNGLQTPNGCSCRFPFHGDSCELISPNPDEALTDSSYCHVGRRAGIIEDSADGEVGDTFGECLCDPLYSGTACSDYFCKYGEPTVDESTGEVVCGCYDGWVGERCDIHERGFCSFTGTVDLETHLVPSCDCDDRFSGGSCQTGTLDLAAGASSSVLGSHLLDLTATSQSQAARVVLTRDHEICSGKTSDTVCVPLKLTYSGGATNAPAGQVSLVASLRLELADELSLSHQLRIVPRFPSNRAAAATCAAGATYNPGTGVLTTRVCAHGEYYVQLSFDGTFNDIYDKDATEVGRTAGQAQQEIDFFVAQSSSTAPHVLGFLVTLVITIAATYR